MTNLLAVGAHPPDVEYYAGATIAEFARNGAHVTLVVATDGERGAGPSRDLASTRRLESERAADMLGARAVIFLALPDGELVNDERLRWELVKAIRGARPALVLAHDPTTLWTESGGATVRLGHSDHRAVGAALLDALHPRASSPSFYLELAEGGLPPWLVREVWLFDTPHPDHFVDLEPARDAKHAALACHVSQLPTRLVERAEAAAESHRPRMGFAAEAFRRLRLL